MSTSSPPRLLAPRRRPGRAAAGALALVVLAFVPACQISWSLGATHGAIVEPSAARASVGIWRAPTRLLHELYEGGGIDLVQDILCDQAAFPPLKLTVGKTSISANVLKARWCGYVYGDDADLRGALVDAQRGSRDDCLALTLISRGAYIKNWTHKSGGCKTGSLR
jgi:hypothetical protein